MSTLDDVNSGLEVVNKTLTTFAPYLGAIPAIGGYIAIGQQIIEGYLALEPKAVALYKQVVGGTPLTAEQVSDYIATYQADDDKLKSDIDAAIAKIDLAAGTATK